MPILPGDSVPKMPRDELPLPLLKQVPEIEQGAVATRVEHMLGAFDLDLTKGQEDQPLRDRSPSPQFKFRSRSWTPPPRRGSFSDKMETSLEQGGHQSGVRSVSPGRFAIDFLVDYEQERSVIEDLDIEEVGKEPTPAARELDGAAPDPGVPLTQEDLEGSGEFEGDLETTLVNEGEKEMVTISQLSSGTRYRIPITVQGQELYAVVDTAAQVTLISDELFKSLKFTPPILKEVVMNTAGKGLQMNGFVAGPFDIQVGSQEFNINMYVAPIGDEMLLGLDFLKDHGST